MTLVKWIWPFNYKVKHEPSCTVFNDSKIKESVFPKIPRSHKKYGKFKWPKSSGKFWLVDYTRVFGTGQWKFVLLAAKFSWATYSMKYNRCIPTHFKLMKCALNSQSTSPKIPNIRGIFFEIRERINEKFDNYQFSKNRAFLLPNFQ